MDKIIVTTSFNIDLEFEEPAFFKRLLAWIMDMFIILGYIYISYSIVQYFFKPTVQSGEDAIKTGYNNWGIQYLLYVPVLVYHLACELWLNGQSIGKKIWGLRVISETGSSASIDQYLIRWLMRIVDFGFSFGILGLITTLANKKKQRLGDLAAGTIVIKTKMQSNLNNTIFEEVDIAYQPKYANILRLTDRDMNVIKKILDSSIQSGNYELAERTADRIRTVLEIKEYQHPIEFLQTILKDYNFWVNNK